MHVMKRRRRRKIKKGITSNEISTFSAKKYTSNDLVPVNVQRPMLNYMLHIQCLKENYFNPLHLMQMNIRVGNYNLLALVFEEYLEKALSYTYKEIGAVDDTLLEWILSDTPIRLWMFDFIRHKYKKYLTK